MPHRPPAGPRASPAGARGSGRCPRSGPGSPPGCDCRRVLRRRGCARRSWTWSARSPGPAPASRQARASRATVRVFPVPAGPTRMSIARPEVSTPYAACAWSSARPASLSGGSPPPGASAAPGAPGWPCSRHSRASMRARSAPSSAAARSGAIARRAVLRRGAQQPRLGVQHGAGGVDLGAVPAPQAQPVRAPVRRRDRHHLRRGQQHRLPRAAGPQRLAGQVLQQGGHLLAVQAAEMVRQVPVDHPGQLVPGERRLAPLRFRHRGRQDPPQPRAGRRPRRPPGAAPAENGVRDRATAPRSPRGVTGLPIAPAAFPVTAPNAPSRGANRA